MVVMEQRLNEQMVRAEQSRQLNSHQQQMQSMSFLTHQSAIRQPFEASLGQIGALPNATTIHHNMSHALPNFTPVSADNAEDRRQIIQWYLNQIALTQEQIVEEQKQLDSQKLRVEKLEGAIIDKEHQKAQKEEQERALKVQVKEHNEALTKQLADFEQLRKRKAFIRFEMEKVEQELLQQKRKIERQDEYAIPKLEKQLQHVEKDLQELRSQYTPTAQGQGGEKESEHCMISPLELSQNFGASDRFLSRVQSGIIGPPVLSAIQNPSSQKVVPKATINIA